MCRVPVKLRELVKQRLAAAAEEIFELLERTIAEYEEETERQRLLDKLLQPRAESGLSEASHVKEEQEALHSDIITSQLCTDVKTEDSAPPSESEEVSSVSVKTEKDKTHTQDAWTQSVHQNQTVDCSSLKQDWTHPLVPLSPPEGSLLHHSQTVDCPGPEQDWAQPSTGAAPDSRGQQRDAAFPHNKRSSKKHKKTAVLRHFCLYCGKGFKCESELERHTRVHTGEKPFRCSVCGNRFSRKDSLHSHLAAHKRWNSIVTSENKKTKTGAAPGGSSEPQKPFSRCKCSAHSSNADQSRSGASKCHACSRCGKTFSGNYRLQRHIHEVHSMEKPFRCSVCGKRFSRKYVLRSHMAAHKTLFKTESTENTSSEPPGGSSEPQQTQNKGSAQVDRSHARPICGRVFSVNDLLERHTGVHSGERRFSCGFCEKRFSRRDSLQSHMITHTRESPYSCSVCGKALTTSQSLKRHLASHQKSAAKRAEGARDKTSLIYCSIDD